MISQARRAFTKVEYISLRARNQRFMLLSWKPQVTRRLERDGKMTMNDYYEVDSAKLYVMADESIYEHIGTHLGDADVTL